MKRLTKGGSQSMYEVKAEKNVYVAMRDGVRLAVDVYRPNAAGEFPALLAMSPYGKEIQTLPIPPQPREFSPLCDGCIEAGDTEYIVAHGYVHVIADVRGTGDSDGEYIGMFSKHEAEDGYDLVEWIARQPWCTGNVGMIGISYFATIQIFVASEQPPHLKAIFPFDPSWMDLYRRAYPGGILATFLHGLWEGRDGDSGFAPRNVVSAMMKTMPKPELDRLFEEALSNPDIRCYSNFYHLLKYPQKNPIFVDLLLNPGDGPFYWERSAHTKYDKVKIPVYTGHVMSAHPAGIDGAISAFLAIDAPKKLLLPPPAFLERPFHEYHDVIIRWFDYWLKGIDTGIMAEPPIRLFVSGANQWRYEHEWPLA
jgi:putative CocE/NonD family hydrolase